jgi:hypothetical protein
MRASLSSGRSFIPSPGPIFANLIAHAPDQHQEYHPLIRPPGPQRMLERCRPIVLHEKVGKPSQCVGNDQSRQAPPPAVHRNRGTQQHPTDDGADAMNHSRGWPAMRTHVRRPKFGKRHERPLACKLLRGAYHKPISSFSKSICGQKKRGAPIVRSASS